MEGDKVVNRNVRLSLFSGRNFTGRRLDFRRAVAVRNLGVFGFNNVLSSFRLSNVVNPNQVTLILFSRTNFRGAFRVFRGSQNVANLGLFKFDNVTSSFILVGRRLTNAQIAQIQSRGVASLNALEISE
nr:beta/gamma crystallin family protein [Paenibacillus sediminis]